MNPEYNKPNGTIPVRRFPVGSLDVYEVTEDELNLIEKYNKNDYDFNCSVFCFSFVLGSISNLLLSDFKSDFSANVFICLLIIMLLAGLYTGGRWFNNRKQKQGIIHKIRSRKLYGESKQIEGE